MLAPHLERWQDQWTCALRRGQKSGRAGAERILRYGFGGESGRTVDDHLSVDGVASSNTEAVGSFGSLWKSWRPLSEAADP